MIKQTKALVPMLTPDALTLLNEKNPPNTIVAIKTNDVDKTSLSAYSCLNLPTLFKNCIVHQNISSRI